MKSLADRRRMRACLGLIRVRVKGFMSRCKTKPDRTPTRIVSTRSDNAPGSRRREAEGLIAGWLLLLVSLGYVAALFALAYYGDRRPLYPNRTWLRPIVYSLALAVYCSSWTFYGAVGTAAQSSLSFLPIYLGPILLFAFGSSLFHRLTVVAKQRNITSIADFIASRFGKSHGLAALVTVIAVTAAIPYIALQFKAVAMSIGVLSGAGTQAVPLY